MQREIKYRVWDHSNHEFVDDMCLHGNGTLLCDHGRTGYCGDFTIQQYTGLKDSKGADICEGDILKHDIGLGPIYYEVVWDETGGCWRIAKDHGGNTGAWFDLYEKVGNIFENPEFLEKCK